MKEKCLYQVKFQCVNTLAHIRCIFALNVSKVLQLSILFHIGFSLRKLIKQNYYYKIHGIDKK